MKTDMISRVEFFCDDKRVGEALRLLVGIAHGAPSVQPVTNAKVKGNGKDKKLVAATPNGSAAELFARYLAETKAETITAALARQVMQQTGFAPNSYSYVFKILKEARAIKPEPGKGKTNASWRVVPDKVLAYLGEQSS
jgi:hypothetical protein